jgi:hypothetical protein
MASARPKAGMAVGIGSFRHVDDLLDFRRLTLLDDDRQPENSMRMSLDSAGIDPRLGATP